MSVFSKPRSSLGIVLGVLVLVLLIASLSVNNYERQPTAPSEQVTVSPVATATVAATMEPVVAGPVVYVAPDGNDANPGTRAAPVQSIQAGLDRLTPGTTLYVRGGTYLLTAPLRLTARGSEGAPILVRGYPGETVVIDGQHKLDQLLVLDGVAWVTVEALTLRNGGGIYGNGLVVVNATDVHLTGITIAEVPNSALYLGPTAERITIIGCDVSGSATGIEIQGHGVLIDGCRSHDHDRMINNGHDCDADPETAGEHGGQAYAVNRTTGPVEIRNSEGWNNRAPSICYGPNGKFVELFHAQNVSIHHNRTWDTPTTLETSGDTSGNRFWRNEVWNEKLLTAHQANGLIITNNTIWNMTGPISVEADQFGSGSTEGFVFTNNIITGSVRFFTLHVPWHPTAVVDYNLYHPLAYFGQFGLIEGTVYATCWDWQSGSGHDHNSVFADPLLINGPDGNFGLDADSPAIGKGMDLSGTGTTMDIGAHQHLDPT